MRNTFKQYNQFNDEEIKQLWKDCLFVLDTNTLLDMYRYSRKTVDDYFKVLTELKTKNQLWIPYQVGYEFYERRITVISEYEGSYKDILSIFEKAKKDIESSYPDHPFLNLKEIKVKMDASLKDIENEITEAKNNHPKWFEKDEVLDKINSLFEENIGADYDEVRKEQIHIDGAERYEKKIPPGFKDDGKPGDNKYGDLILWYQIIDKAKVANRPIVFISRDSKEDWWLKKNGQKIMPLPQLKKEMIDNAGVDFHIYTGDRFLGYYRKSIDEKSITEVKQVREMEEKRMIIRRGDLARRYRDTESLFLDKYSLELLQLFDRLRILMMEIKDLGVYLNYQEELEYRLRKLKYLRDKIRYGDSDPKLLKRFHLTLSKNVDIFNKIIYTEDIDPQLTKRIRLFTDRLEHLKPD